MRQSLTYLAPEGQTYGWFMAEKMKSRLGLDIDLVPQRSQPGLLMEILNGTSEHAACLVAYSNNLGKHAVPEIGESIKRYTRTDTGGVQRLRPEQLVAIGRTSIEQCLIGKQGTQLSDVRRVYAHAEGRNQGSSFLSRTFKKQDIEIIECSSNGEAPNRALDDDCVSSVAIGPAFAKNTEQIVIRSGIDNNVGSETSFALISSSKNPLIIPKDYTHKGRYGAILYAKVDQIGDSQFPLALELFGVERYANRSTNSPASGKPVIGKDVMAESPEVLKNLITGLNEGLPGMKIEVSMGGSTKTIEGDRGVEEHNYLGPCPVFQV